MRCKVQQATNQALPTMHYASVPSLPLRDIEIEDIYDASQMAEIAHEQSWAPRLVIVN